MRLAKDAMKTVLLIDDQDDYREVVRHALEDRGIEVIDADSPDSAYSLLHNQEAPDLIICDLHMPFTKGEKKDEFITSAEVGVKTLHELSWVYPKTPVFALTSLCKIDIEKIREHLQHLPAYEKSTSLANIVEIVTAYLECEHFGGVN